MASKSSTGSSGTSAGAHARCSAISSRRSWTANESSGAGPPSFRVSSTAAATSVSKVHDRLLRLSEPTLAHRSSMTQALECT